MERILEVSRTMEKVECDHERQGSDGILGQGSNPTSSATLETCDKLHNLSQLLDA